MSYKKYLQSLDQTTDCPFCSLKKELFIDDTEHSFVLANRAPYEKDHILICPKKHRKTLFECSEQELQDIYQLIGKRNKILYERYEGLAIVLREGEVGGKTGKSIDHLHRHIIPNYSSVYGGSKRKIDNREFYNDKEILSITQRLKNYKI